MNKNQLVDLVAEGIRWEAPFWRTCGLPTNVFSQRRYGGMNAVRLAVERISLSYTSDWWGTYKQWMWVQCRVKARPDDVQSGQWGVRIIRYEHAASLHTVFNAAQVLGVDSQKWKSPFTILDRSEYNRVEADLIARTKTGVKTLAELVRGHVTPATDFESLVSEIGLCYLESELSLPHDPDMTEYRRCRVAWLDNMRQDYLSKAVYAAEQIVDRILERKVREES
jgi:antirestriction protein ArdC